MKVIELPDKKLRQRSLEVSLPLSEEDDKIAQELIKYLELSKDPRSGLRPGIGIAAVQLGYLKRMFYIDVSDGEGNSFQELLINPTIIGRSKEDAALEQGEGCLSVNEDAKGQEGLVHRHAGIIIRGYSYLTKQEVEYSPEGFLAIVFQHEYDHLDGKLFIDRIDHKNPWAKRKDEYII